MFFVLSLFQGFTSAGRKQSQGKTLTSQMVISKTRSISLTQKKYYKSVFAFNVMATSLCLLIYIFALTLQHCYTLLHCKQSRFQTWPLLPSTHWLLKINQKSLLKFEESKALKDEDKKNHREVIRKLICHSQRCHCRVHVNSF